MVENEPEEQQMRADRLLSLLMLLQSRGSLKARELAKELEVSERTIYRDIDALGAAGVPIYGEPGPEGGYALVDSYRTNLTGLTEGEVRALFMLSIPAPLMDLGVSQELRAALLKLSAALPAARRGDEERVRQRFYIDSTWWRQREEPVPHLGTIHQAVWQDLKLYITYHPPYANQIRRLVAPYGLVAKAGVWHLVYARNGSVRVFPVSDLADVQLSDESFERPADFDLATFWEAWCVGYEAWFTTFSARVRVAPAFIPALPRYFGSQIHARLAEAGPPDFEGWIELTLSFESFAAARERILGFGRGVEVLQPLPLRRSILDFAEQIVDLYATSSIGQEA
jgi:predicted DNA-binding transcriptional regulator YafY